MTANVASEETFEEKSGNSFGHFEKAVMQMIGVAKEEVDKREAEYQRTKKTATKKG